MSKRHQVSLARMNTRLILQYRRSRLEWLDGRMAAVAVAALTVIVIGVAIVALVHGKGQTALLMLLAGAVGGAGVWEHLQEADCTTEFDLAARTVVSKLSGWQERQLGPVSFDQIAALDTAAGWLGRSRAAVATLRLNDGSQWKLGRESVFVRRISTSVIPSLLTEIRVATGLPGTDDPG